LRPKLIGDRLWLGRYMAVYVDAFMRTHRRQNR
jgi:hypothetical protein